jgi:vitamin B12/bleomycin/antimicrobial peptide transport system ATP-binding/permease protein
MFGRHKIKPEFETVSNDNSHGITISYDPNTRDVSLKNLSLSRPDDGGALINSFDLTVKQGDRIVLTGPRGCGKSSLLRAIAGLWDHGEGQITLPAGVKILCVPQRPYLPPVPLRGILSYPKEAGFYTDEEMAGALRDVGLERLVPFLNDEEHDGGYWTSRFSPGEQQALIFARIFLQKPDVLMLDEATSSLDEISAVAMYRKILEKFPDITLISIVHHKEIIPFHDLHASIENKNLTVRTIASEAAPAAPAPDAP